MVVWIPRPANRTESTRLLKAAFEPHTMLGDLSHGFVDKNSMLGLTDRWPARPGSPGVRTFNCPESAWSRDGCCFEGCSRSIHTGDPHDLNRCGSRGGMIFVSYETNENSGVNEGHLRGSRQTKGARAGQLSNRSQRSTAGSLCMFQAPISTRLRASRRSAGRPS